MLVAEGANARPLIRAAASARPLRVLVVEDQEVLRSGLRWLLTRVPWVEHCAGARNADEALRLAASIAFDVALVDVDLGAECGLQASERLRAATAGLHIALLTSRWDLVPMRTARAAGAARRDRQGPARPHPARGCPRARRRRPVRPRRRGPGRSALRSPRARDPPARRRGPDQRRDRRVALPRARHDQAPHARALRQARRAQSRGGRPLRAPARRAGRSSRPGCASRAHRQVRG